MNELRKMMAAQVASGLIASHGIDHGGVEPETIAHKALCIADAIIAQSDYDPNDAGSQRYGSGSTSGETGEASSNITQDAL